MLFTYVSVVLLSVFAVATLAIKGWRDHSELLAVRGHMLDACAGLLADAKIAVGPDSFPTLTGRLDDGRKARVELIADTLVTRRLPQLWLRLTVVDKTPRRTFSIGALARATGAEFYSIVAELPDRIAMASELPLMVRGKQVTRRIEQLSGAALNRLFADPQLKEAAVTPVGVRIVRQASQGDRASHLLLRQVRFAGGFVPRDALASAIEDAITIEQEIAESKPRLELA